MSEIDPQNPIWAKMLPGDLQAAQATARRYAAFRDSIAAELATKRAPSQDWNDLSCSSLERGKGKRRDHRRPPETVKQPRKRKKSKYE